MRVEFKKGYHYKYKFKLLVESYMFSTLFLLVDLLLLIDNICYNKVYILLNTKLNLSKIYNAKQLYLSTEEE